MFLVFFFIILEYCSPKLEFYSIFFWILLEL